MVIRIAMLFVGIQTPQVNVQKDFSNVLRATRTIAKESLQKKFNLKESFKDARALSLVIKEKLAGWFRQQSISANKLKLPFIRRS